MQCALDAPSQHKLLKGNASLWFKCGQQYAFSQWESLHQGWNRQIVTQVVHNVVDNLRENVGRMILVSRNRLCYYSGITVEQSGVLVLQNRATIKETQTAQSARCPVPPAVVEGLMATVTVIALLVKRYSLRDECSKFSALYYQWDRVQSGYIADWFLEASQFSERRICPLSSSM